MSTKKRSKSMQTSAKTALARAKRSPAPAPAKSVNPVVVGAALLVGGLASGLLGGLVLERTKGVTGKVESKARAGKAAIESKSREYAEQAQVTAKALKQSAKEALYGRTDPEWYTREIPSFGVVEARVIGGDQYIITPAPEGTGFLLFAGSEKTNSRDQLEGPGEDGEWTTPKAVKKYVDRITKNVVKANPRARSRRR